MIKLIFLGTGNALNPEKLQSAYCISTEKYSTLIDCGNTEIAGNLKKAGVSLNEIKDIFISHHHGDHISGLSQFLFQKMFNDEGAKVRIFGPVKTLPVIRDFAFKTHDFTRINSRRIAFVALKNKQTVKQMPGISVTPVKVKGSDKSKMICFGYAVTSGKTKIVYTADMQPSRNFDGLAKGADVLIHECGGLQKNLSRVRSIGHSTARDAGECARKAGVKHLILTHLPEGKIVKPAELVNEARQYFSGKITVAEDGMEIGI
jgi:ribonuclease BN (tRNA processing enzyme)